MSTSTVTPLRVVLYEGSGSRALTPDRRLELLRSLLEAGFQVTLSNGGGEVSSPDSSHLLVLTDLEGPEPWAERDVDTEQDGRTLSVRFRDISGQDAEAVVGLARDVAQETESYTNDEWKPWFPVIDFKRCTNCMQCLSFCLFDVYGVDDDKNIQVQNPDKCKTNCPACSRVCPEVAILFPKYGSGPINGDEVNVEDVEREKMKVDITALLGGDIYSMLRDRHRTAQSRFSKERDESKALKERVKCLKKLQDDMDIPPEVLMSLPSLDQIKEKAAEAHTRARQALQDRDDAGTPESN